MAEDVIGLAADHAGFDLKARVRERLEAEGRAVLDLGTDGPESVDYPDVAQHLAAALADGRVTRGVLICGTGIGVAIAANRHPWVRAAVCGDVTGARLARQHNDANVLALGARLVGIEVAFDCVRTFLATEFEGGRHARRVAMLGGSPQDA